MMTALLPIIVAYSKTIDLIISIRADLTPEQRKADLARWYRFIDFWDGLMEKIVRSLEIESDTTRGATPPPPPPNVPMRRP